MCYRVDLEGSDEVLGVMSYQGAASQPPHAIFKILAVGIFCSPHHFLNIALDAFNKEDLTVWKPYPIPS